MLSRGESFQSYMGVTLGKHIKELSLDHKWFRRLLDYMGNSTLSKGGTGDACL